MNARAIRTNTSLRCRISASIVVPGTIVTDEIFLLLIIVVRICSGRDEIPGRPPSPPRVSYPISSSNSGRNPMIPKRRRTRKTQYHRPHKYRHYIIDIRDRPERFSDDAAFGRGASGRGGTMGGGRDTRGPYDYASRLASGSSAPFPRHRQPCLVTRGRV